MKKIIPIFLALLIVPSLALAQNTTNVAPGVSDTNIPLLSVISPNKYFKVTQSNVKETNNNYNVKATVKVKYSGGNHCNHNAIRQLSIDVDETNELLQCKGIGLGVCSPKKVKFNFKVPKKKIDNIVEKNGKATLIAGRHSGWSCRWVKNRYPREQRGIKVHTFNPAKKSLTLIFAVILAASVVGFGIYKFVIE